MGSANETTWPARTRSAHAPIPATWHENPSDTVPRRLLDPKVSNIGRQRYNAVQLALWRRTDGCGLQVLKTHLSRFCTADWCNVSFAIDTRYQANNPTARRHTVGTPSARGLGPPTRRSPRIATVHVTWKGVWRSRVDDDRRELVGQCRQLPHRWEPSAGRHRRRSNPINHSPRLITKPPIIHQPGAIAMTYSLAARRIRCQR